MKTGAKEVLPLVWVVYCAVNPMPVIKRADADVLIRVRPWLR